MKEVSHFVGIIYRSHPFTPSTIAPSEKKRNMLRLFVFGLVFLCWEKLEIDGAGKCVGLCAWAGLVESHGVLGSGRW